MGAECSAARLYCQITKDRAVIAPNSHKRRALAKPDTPQNRCARPVAPYQHAANDWLGRAQESVAGLRTIMARDVETLQLIGHRHIPSGRVVRHIVGNSAVIGHEVGAGHCHCRIQKQ